MITLYATYVESYTITSRVSPSDVDLIRTKGYREGFIQPTRLMPKLGGDISENAYRVRSTILNLCWVIYEIEFHVHLTTQVNPPNICCNPTR